MNLNILYEDNHLIAVYKPAGLLVQADEGGEVCLMDKVKEYLKEKYAKPGNVFLGLLHRLDRPVSGIVLFAKTSKGASRLSEQFRTHAVKKIYTAVVCGNVVQTEQKTLINYLVKDEVKNKTTVYEHDVPGSHYAELSYKVIGSNQRYSLVEVELKTGRSHQIRAQLAYDDHPIVGDVKYGAPEPLPDKSIALAEVCLKFETATNGEKKELLIRPPEFWKTFIDVSYEPS